MDDNRRKASFPLMGDYVTMMQPTDGQIMALIMGTGRKGDKVNTAAVTRICRIIESLMTADDWEKVEDALIEGRMWAGEFVSFAYSVIDFKWPDREEEPEPTPAPEGPKLLP